MQMKYCWWCQAEMDSEVTESSVGYGAEGRTHCGSILLVCTSCMWTNWGEECRWMRRLWSLLKLIRS